MIYNNLSSFFFHALSLLLFATFIKTGL